MAFDLSQLLSGLNNPGFKGFAGNALSDLGYGLTRGKNLNEGFQYATQRTAELDPMRTAELEQRQKNEQEQQALSRTADYLETVPGGKPYADAMRKGGMNGSDAFRGWFELSRPRPPGDAPATVQEWEYFNKLPPEQQSQYLRMKRSTPFLDIGTGFVQPDVVNPGQIAGQEIIKDNMTPAYDAAFGAGMGKIDVETRAAADSLASKLPGLKSVVSELGDLAKTATYTQTGQLFDAIVRETGQMPPEGAIARTKYMAMVDNQVLPLLRDTFGSAFTVTEGDNLRATLGNPNVSPVEKQAILEAFIEQKVRDLQALQSRLPNGGGAQMPGNAGGGDVESLVNKYLAGQ